MNPGVVEHNGPYDQCYGTHGDHADSHALVSELLIQPARFFYCLGRVSKAKNSLDQGAKPDNQHANASNHAGQISVGRG
ncbi:hypothetical protein [Brucella intermedia]|uniref:hypothetical protein n=1 Tax=Brucella intermedia TaxID=94625 RepID=UPI00224B30EE|nr:hypothetical protein [Brucella intermedia]